MTRRVRVYVLGMHALLPLMRGEARVRNLPADARMVALSPTADGKRLGVMVDSSTFPVVPHGQQVPIVCGVLEELRGAAVAA